MLIRAALIILQYVDFSVRGKEHWKKKSEKDVFVDRGHLTQCSHGTMFWLRLSCLLMYNLSTTMSVRELPGMNFFGSGTGPCVAPGSPWETGRSRLSPFL